MTRLRVIDLETTGMEPPAEIIEFGCADVVAGSLGVSVSPPAVWLFRPLGEIPAETMAVHHITLDDIPADAPSCTAQNLRAAVWSGPPPDVFVAHNCDFERRFIAEEITSPAPWICTYKAALHLWPDAPKHGNQVLRYWRGLRLDPALAMPPHRAAPDAWVTAQLLSEMVRLTSIEQLIAWTNQPRPIPLMPFGMHRGTPWAAIPADYLTWIVSQPDMDADVAWHARQELARRQS
jgi:exodeoxyribonuclease X